METIFASDSNITLLLENTNEEAIFKIILNTTNEEIGNITYTYENDDLVGNLFYFIYEKYREKHYAKDALKLLIENMIKIDNNDLYLAITPNNVASEKLALSQNATFIKKVNLPTGYVYTEDGVFDYANMYKIKIRKQ